MDFGLAEKRMRALGLGRVQIKSAGATEDVKPPREFLGNDSFLVIVGNESVDFVREKQGKRIVTESIILLSAALRSSVGVFGSKRFKRTVEKSR